MAEEIIIEKKTPQVLKIVLAIVISAVIFGLLGYYLGKNNKNTDDSTVPVAETAVIESASPTVTSSLSSTATSNSRYQNTDYGFSFILPNGYAIQETQMFEGARGVTLSFGKIKSTNVSQSQMVSLQYYADDDRSLSKLEEEFRGKSGSDLSDRKDLSIDGHPAFSYMVGGLASGKTVISTNGKASVEIGVYPDNNDTRAFIDNLASSFKF